MATWSGIRNKLEQDYLAKSLQGRVTYFATSYTNAHDQIGRAAIRAGFNNQSFYQAFTEFDNQSIEASLASGNLLVRIFAVLDRRLGKRRLERLSKAWGSEPEYLKFFLHLRMEAEGVRML